MGIALKDVLPRPMELLEGSEHLQIIELESLFMVFAEKFTWRRRLDIV